MCIVRSCDSNSDLHLPGTASDVSLSSWIMVVHAPNRSSLVSRFGDSSREYRVAPPVLTPSVSPPDGSR